MEINSTTTFIFDFWFQQEIKQLSRVWKKFARSNRNSAQTLITQDHRIEPRRFPFVTRTRGEHRWCHLHLPVSPSTAKDTRVNLPHFAVWRNTIVDDKGCSLSNKERRLIVTRFTILSPRIYLRTSLHRLSKLLEQEPRHRLPVTWKITNKTGEEDVKSKIWV